MAENKQTDDSLLSALRAIAKKRQPAEKQTSKPVPQAAPQTAPQTAPPPDDPTPITPDAPSAALESTDTTPDIMAEVLPPEDMMSAQSIIIDASQYVTSVHAIRTDETPWVLQQFFDDEIDLEEELTKRFPEMAVMSTFKSRHLGKNKHRTVATVSTSDGAAQAVFDLDKDTGKLILSFTLGAMLTLRFSLHDLSAESRERWLALMRRDDGGLAFLWGTARWENDYLIAVSGRHYTSLYAFSPNNFEAGIRITTQIKTQLVDWLEDTWGRLPPDTEDAPPPLLTW